MAKQGGVVARFLIKWLVIPVGLAAIGFFVVGPRLGAPPRPSPEPPATHEDAKGKEPSKFKGEPEVEISSRPITRRKPPRRRNRSANTVAPRNAPAQTDPPVAEPPAPADPPPTSTTGGAGNTF